MGQEKNPPSDQPNALLLILPTCLRVAVAQKKPWIPLLDQTMSLLNALAARTVPAWHGELQALECHDAWVSIEVCPRQAAGKRCSNTANFSHG
jgi:hypothetical protein